jgi:hypothetical protein
MRFYQDTRGFDSLYFDPQAASLYGGVDGALYALEGGEHDAGTAIALTWISRFQDQGFPENEKTYQDLVIEHDTGGTELAVRALLDNGSTNLLLGTISSTSRTFSIFRVGADEQGRKAKNFAVMIQGNKAENPDLCQLYSVVLHYYVEPRNSLTWDSDELDLGTQAVNGYRAIELDINNPGEVQVLVYTDMPGNAMAQRGAPRVVPASTTRRKYQVPLGRPYMEGRLVRVIVKSTDGTTTFQLYGARIETQPFGEYVEGYESTAGREWDSGTVDLGSPHVKEIREVMLDLDADGALTFDLHTELPGLAMQSRTTKSVNTELTTTGRRPFTLPLLADGAPYEGRLLQMFLRGTAAWRLYGCWLFARPIGYYVEAYQAAAGHVWDSTVLDLGSPLVKRILTFYCEAHADSPLTVRVYTSNANGEMTLRDTQFLPGSVGRRPYTMPLSAIYGRLARVVISSTGAFRLFVARLSVKPIGVYLNAGSSEVFPVETEQDLASERVKQFKEIELVHSSAGGGTLKFYSDPLGTLTLKGDFALTTTSGTETIKLGLPIHAKGRLIRCEFRPGTGDLQVFACRVWTRLVGEAGKMVWQWVTLPIPSTPDNYGWVDLYVAPTPPAYEWIPVWVPPTQTPKWDWADLPVKP